MIIIGGGLGGLLSAALYSKDQKVILFERSRELGGRFRNFDRDGYALTTGALHMLPHGSTGPLAQILHKVGANCKIVDSDPYGTFLYNGRELTFSEIRKSLPMWDKIRVSKLFLKMRYSGMPDISVQEYFNMRYSDEIYLKVAKCFLGWSLSVSPSELSMNDLAAIVKNIFNYKGPGIPMGGCGGVIRALEQVLEKNKVLIIHKKVEQILIEDGKVLGVATEDGEEYLDDIVVSDIGAKATSKICPPDSIGNELRDTIKDIVPSAGIKLNISCGESLIKHNGVLFPLDCERVEGALQVTNVDRSLAPQGRHLVMSHQTLVGRNIRSEVERGVAELEDIFKGHEIELICAQTYFGKNPVNRASQGQDLSVDSFQIEGLYIVGDSVKGPGGIEVDGISMGVIELYNKIKKS